MKILSKKEQKELMDFIGEEYLVAQRSNLKGCMSLAKFGNIQTKVFRIASIIAGDRGIELLNARVDPSCRISKSNL